MIARIGLPKLITLSGALLMAVIGLALSHMTGDREGALAPRQVGPAGPPPLSAAVPASPLPAVKPAPETSAQEAAPKVEQADAPRMSASSAKSAAPQVTLVSSSAVQPASRPASPPKPAPRASSTRSLPPLPPPDWSTDDAPAEPSGPPPGVLWLSGVIQGEPPVAVLRRGDSRFVVKEGDVIEDRYTVSQIGTNSIVLKRGSRKLTLRVGQY